MLTRYKIHRGKRPADDPLLVGVRQDTRHRTKRPLRPTSQIVDAYLGALDDADSWPTFERAYLELLEARFKQERAAFDELAAVAQRDDVYLGCNCPTQKNPRVERCHTFLALQFMNRKYAGLDVVMPKPT